MSGVGSAAVANRGDRRLILSLAVVLCLVVLAATLTPAPDWDDSKRRVLCVACEQRVAVDALGNAVLLLPLGFCLSVASISGFRTVVAALAFSISIEVAQSVIPGRTPNLGDVLFNVTGAAVGWMLSRKTAPGRAAAHTLLRGVRSFVFPSERLEIWLSLGAAATVAGLLITTCLLLTPDFPEGSYVAGSGALDANNGPLYLGGNPRDQDFLRGSIDEVRIFRHPRRAAEIRDDMIRAVSRDDPDILAEAGLIAAYDFDHDTADMLTDVSGHGHNGVASRAVYVQGKFGRGLKFSGSAADIAAVPYSPDFDLFEAMTIEAWVNPTELQGNWGNIVQKDEDAYFLTAGSDAGALRSAGGGSFAGELDSVKLPQPIPVGVWTHLAITYDAGTLALYVNGEPATVRQRWSSVRLSQGSVGTVYIGMERTRRSADFRTQLIQGAPLRLRLEPGSWHDALAPLVQIRDQRQQEILFAGIESENVVLRARVVAARLGLHVPASRFQAAWFQQDPDKSRTITISRKQKRYCVGVGADGRCGFGPSIASGWAFLIDSASISSRVEELFDLVWLGLMFFVAGLCTYQRRTSYAAVLVLALVLLLLPVVAGLPTVPRTVAFGGFVALLSGWYWRIALQRMVLRVS